jgi:hypothetical protein
METQTDNGAELARIDAKAEKAAEKKTLVQISAMLSAILAEGKPAFDRIAEGIRGEIFERMV